MGSTAIDSRPVAVTGANGFVGAHVVRALRAAGLPVRAIVRTTGAAAGLRAQGCEVALADVRTRGSLNDALGGCRALIHLVAVIRERAGATFDAVNRAGTDNVAAAARDAGVTRIVHLSALGAGPAAPRYLRSKWDGEEALRSASVPYVIFRPSFIFGTGGGSARELADLIRAGPWYPIAQMTGWEGVARLAAVTPVVPVMGSGHYRSMPVHAGDLMQAVIQAVERDDVLGRVFEIGGPQTVTFNALLEAIADTLHLRRRLVHIPLRLARGLAWTMAVLPNPAITRDELDSLLLDNVCDNTDVVRTFGLTLTPLRESLRLALSESRNGES